MRFLLTVLFGMLPEILYFTLFISNTKNIKEKRLKLFVLLCISYCLCVTIQRWQLIFYLLWGVSIYVILKLLYRNKVQIIDIFIITLAYFWIMLLSSLLIIFVDKDMSNYMFVYFIQRILLFSPFIFRKYFNKLYKKYCKLWNRNDAEKRPIKSITLRNISLILLNGFIFLADIALINIINFIK